MLTFNTVPSEDLKVTGIQCWVLASHAETKKVLMILWIVHGKIPKFLATVCWEILIMPHFLLNHDTCYYLTFFFYLWNGLNRYFFEHSTTFLAFCLPIPTFLELVAGIKFRMSENLHKTIKFLSLSSKYAVFVLYSIKYIGWKVHSCFLNFSQCPNIFEAGVVYYNYKYYSILQWVCTGVYTWRYFRWNWYLMIMAALSWFYHRSLFLYI